MTEAHDHDRSPRPHAQQATRPSPTTQADMRPESQRRKRSSFIKAKRMLRLSFFRKPSCARMRLPGNVSSRKPHETRPRNKTMERHAGKGPRGEALGGTPRRNVQKCSKLASNVAFFRTSAANATLPSLQLNITPGRFLKEIRTQQRRKQQRPTVRTTATMRTISVRAATA